MNSILGTLDAVLTGKIKPFARNTVSGIDKTVISGSILAGKHGLEGDEQGDLKVHGGPDKAIHHYPAEHYTEWKAILGEHGLLQAIGAFGENFSSHELTEKDICLGDIIQLGTALLEVSQCRQPCWKLNERFSQPEMAMMLQKTGMVGWYYRVLTPGVIQAGDTFWLQHRPFPDWPLTRVAALMFADSINAEALHQFAQLPLTLSWRKTITRRLDTGEIEDWSPRINGH